MATKRTAAKKTQTSSTATTDIDLKSALNEHFGFKDFKGQQVNAIQSLLSGRDTFVIMPTGGGKSLCYQLPAMILPGVAIIVMPLIPLIENQEDLVKGYKNQKVSSHLLKY